MALKFSCSAIRAKQKQKEQEQVKRAQEEREIEVERAKEYSRKYPERYLPIVDAVEIPLPKKGNVELKLKIVVQRDGNDDTEDIENPIMLDIRLYIRRPDDTEFIPTKKGIHIPYGENGAFMRHFADTLLEVFEDIEARRANGDKF